MQNKQKNQIRICVTGGVGFIGNELIKKLNELGYNNILMVDDEKAFNSRFAGEIFFGQKFQFTIEEFKDYNKILETKDFLFLDEIDFCYHLGANSSTRASLKESFDSNLCFTAELFKRAKFPIVFASSGAVYDSYRNINPENDYGITKLLGEKLAESIENIVCLRYHNVYGATEEHKGDMASLVYKWIAKKNRPIKIEKLFYDSDKIFRDFVHIDDVTKINVMFLDMWLKYKNFMFFGNTFDVGTGKSVSFQKLADEIVNNTKNEIEYIPNPYKSGYQLYTKANMYKIKKLYYLVYQENLKTIKIKKGIKMVYENICRKAILI
jgi:ADP-L-glycero-D-manno-heptose 6-epimerase